MRVTPLPIVTLARLVQSENAYPAMSVTPLPIRHTGQSGAAPERPRTDVRNAVGDDDARQAGAALELPPPRCW